MDLTCNSKLALVVALVSVNKKEQEKESKKSEEKRVCGILADATVGPKS